VKVRTYRDLLIWQRGMDLTRTVYQGTGKMPREEIFGLTSQMRRASSSIPMNIAEGYGKHTRPEYLRGLRLAMGSLCELSTAYEIATSLNLIKASQEVLDAIAEEDRMIQSVIIKLETKTEQEAAAKQRTPRA
jgi:four helix bundle protein